ncbi:MAG: YifB family Mg chelatase-like AAA ATPase [Verrucomicrobiota bacterium]
MLSRVFSAAVQGVDAIEVEIEVNAGGGQKDLMVIVGLPDVAVRESRDRVWTAVCNSSFRVPSGRTTINLAPADVKKEGPIFDLPIAVGIVALETELKEDALEIATMVGELGLDGSVRPVRGVLPMTLEARRQGKKAILVPHDNASEAAVVDGIFVYPVKTLQEAVSVLRGDGDLKPYQINRKELFESQRDYLVDFSEVKGQYHVKRAIEVAAAGSHNLLFVGPPGTGKSMLAKRIPTILPNMTEAEAIETTKIHSVAGLLGSKDSLIVTRPFRAPHHTISEPGLLGGSSNPRPGEISLSHNGVLFLDELPEFQRSTLEVLRQPLEDGEVNVTRAAASVTFPARSVLVAALNPCPCGYFGDPKRECRCSRMQIEKYRQRISGPLLDRIDIHVEVPLIEYKELSSAESGESSAAVRERVEAAREIQNARYSEFQGVASNAAMPPKLIREHCALDEESSGMLEQAMTTLNFSARAHDRILKVARTIADLAGAEKIATDHIMEAINYRALDRNLWE